MAEPTTAVLTPPPIDPRSGFCAETKTFHSLRPAVPLPPQNLPLSFPSYVLSLLPSPLPSNPAFIDAATAASLSFPELLTRVRSLASSLSHVYGLSHGHVAFILSPSSLDVPVLYLALLSIGAVATPSNPASTPSEISRQCRLVSPSVAFATSSTASKLPRHVPTILLDSPDFHNLLMTTTTTTDTETPATPPSAADVSQSDVASIQFSSGTTGRVKAAAIPHRSLIAQAAGFHHFRRETETTMLIAPLFHSMGFFYLLKGVALGNTTVLVGRPGGIGEMLSAAERYGVTEMTAAPPVVVAMARSEEAVRRGLRRLGRVRSGGAPLGVEALRRFMERFPGVEVCQGYGATEAGGIARMIGFEECRHLKSVGRLTDNVEAKIVDNVTGKALSVGQQGELWVRGPALMSGYIGDDEANASTFDSNGWLKTGDLCYFDKDGFLYIVDRLKELIKYKAYQVPPAELEHLLHSIPEIADVAVIPHPHEEAGQIPVAYIVRQKGSRLSEAQVMDYVAKQVAPYKKIRKVVFVSSIPKSASGKILRRELANHALCNPMPRL